jgi:uncharacterized membrane protein (UPF0182 family)
MMNQNLKRHRKARRLYGPTLLVVLLALCGAARAQQTIQTYQEPTTISPDSTPTPTPTPSTSPPSGAGGTNPAVDKAVADMNAALSALAAAQRSGDFAAQGQALADLQKAVQEYQTAQSAASSSPASPTG